MFIRIFFYLICASLFSFEGWTHLELGAGNYGADGHTKSSQRKTVLMKIKNVSAAKNYIDDLEEVGTGDYKPEEQYQVLFWTLDELVSRYGDVGIFHVNDLYEEYANFAAEKLQNYAHSKGYASVVIEAIPGDYEWLDAATTLAKYGKNQYKSVHLKNPEISFYYDQIDGDIYATTPETRQKTRDLLSHLASLSEEGLFLFILNHPNFIPPEEKEEFMDMGIFYQGTTLWPSVSYVYPDGYVVSRDRSVVYFIPSEKTALN